MADQKNEGPGGGPPQLSMEQGGQYQPGQVQVTMAMAGQGQLPTLAPAPLQGQIPGQQQPPQMHGAGSPMQGPGQPQQQMMMQQTVNQMGQPQFQIIQPSFSQAPGQYASGSPQMAFYNSQGQLVLQPAAQFLQPGQPGQQGQMILASQLPQQKAGQQHMIAGGPGQQGKPMPGQPQQQPQYLISSTGQLQIPPGQQQMQPPMNLMLPGGMQVAMPGQPGQVMKTADGKPVAGGQPGMPGQPQPQLIAMPGGGMAYMQAGPQQFLTQNGQMMMIRAPGTQEQQLMFSPSGTPPSGPPQGPPPGHQGPPPGHQGPVPPGQQTVSMAGPQGPQQRPGMPQAPPGKTAISRSIAPLLNTNSQSQPRMGYNGNMPNQPSPNPKSKQKMSPRGGMNGMGPGRPPGPKPNQPMKGPVMQRMSGPGQAGSPGPQGQMNPGSPRPMLQTSMAPSMPMVSMASMAPQMMAMPGPPTLTPMMFPTQPTAVPVSSVTGPPPIASMSMALPPMTLAQLPTQPLDQTSLPPTSAPMPLGMTLHAAPDVGPPTLTMEAPMPNLGPPNLANLAPIKAPPPAPEPTAPTPVAKAVQAVKPQVLTHVIDGHIIKESSQPFPVSPTKKRSALGKPMSRAINDIQKMLDKDIEDSSLSAPKQKDDSLAPVSNAPVKRGPGRPPGSNNKNTETKNSKSLPGEPPEKKPKAAPVEAVTPLSSALTKQATPPTPPSAPLVPKVNIARWSVTEVCDFIKKLPGCSDYVEDFMVQEIDGQALMLLQADHLMSAMSIKLGPALKICEQVNQLKNDFAKNCRQEQQARHSEAEQCRARAPASDQTKPNPVKRVVFRLGHQVLGKASFLSDTEEEEHGEKLVMDFSDEEETA